MCMTAVLLNMGERCHPPFVKQPRLIIVEHSRFDFWEKKLLKNQRVQCTKNDDNTDFAAQLFTP